MRSLRQYMILAWRVQANYGTVVSEACKFLLISYNSPQDSLLLVGKLRKMLDLNVSPAFLEVLGNKSAVTLVRLFFAA